MQTLGIWQNAKDSNMISPIKKEKLERKGTDWVINFDWLLKDW